MKQSRKYFVMMVATLLIATSVWAGGTVRVVKMLNGTVNDAAGTVTPNISEGVCTLTVTPAQGNYITVENITAERTVDGGLAKGRRKTPAISANDITVENLADNTNPSGTTTYKFTIPEDENFDIEVVADFQSCISIAEAVITLAETTSTYDGEAKEPAVSSVMLGNTTLTASTDYTVEYSDNVNAGTATVTVKGQGIYEDEATTTFTINRSALSNLAVSITGWTYGKYNAENNSPSVQGNVGSGAVTYTYADATAVEPSYSETVPANAGSYIVKATVAETGNYAAGEATQTFTIAKADISPSVSIEGWTYGDTPNEPVVEGNLGNGAVDITYQGDNLAESSTTAPTQAGGYTVHVSVAETTNYNAGNTSKEFSIEKADFSEVVIANITDQTFTGDPVEPTVSLTFNDSPVDASEYEVDYGENHVDVGTVTITITSKGINFSSDGEPLTKTFQIVPAQVVVTAEDETVTYNGGVQLFDYYEVEGVEDLKVVVSYYATEENRAAGQYPIGDQDIVNVGDYYVRLVSGDSNYTFDPVDVTFTIDPKNLNNVDLWTNISEEGFAYTGAPITLEDGTFVLTDTDIDEDLMQDTDFNVTYANNTNVGTATVTLTGMGNYTGQVSFNFDIVRNLNISFSESDMWATYYAEENLQIPTGLKAYIVTNISESIVTVEEISYIPQNVGVLLNYVGNIESLPNEFLAKAYTDATGDFDNNQLQGTDAGTAVSSITGGAVYVLYNDEFVKSTTGTIPANRAYLVLDDAVYGGGNSRTLTIAINTITGIADVNATTLANGQYYNLQGMRMTQPRKGIVIVNGKKMFVK